MMPHHFNHHSALLIGVTLVFCISPISAYSGDQVVSPVPDAKVSRAQFTSGINDREPIDKLVKVDSSITNLFYFTELLNLQGHQVSHRWEHDGEVVSNVSFMVEGPRWRVFSKKTLEPSRLGKWTVFVVDESGWPIHASIFEYTGEAESLDQ